MMHRFGPFVLDIAARELRREGVVVALEPQVFDLIRLLIERRERVVGRDEIIAEVWSGRFVSDSAVSSRIKSARRALGDDGEAQCWIRTSAKRGYRFVGEAKSDPADAASIAPAELMSASSGRPALAVLPFALLGGTDPLAAAAAEGVPHDLITGLSRLRWLRVIARASSFRLHGRSIEQVQSALDVRYVLSGTVERSGPALIFTVDLSDAQDARVVWRERYAGAADDLHMTRERIARSVVTALDLHIPLDEASRADLRSPEALDAWAAYHVGLRHLYRFNNEGSARATACFERAVQLEPGFARAYAGLSFAAFENAFLRFVADSRSEAVKARTLAERSLELDPLDPFCNLVMGRSHWLAGDLETSHAWLERAIDLNPNYAQAHYSRAWTETMLGRGRVARSGVQEALRLSPLDPLAYGMLAVRAMSHILDDQPVEAAAWGERAARAPAAHALIALIAAITCSLAGEAERADAWVRTARQRAPDLTAARFMEAFPFQRSRDQREVAAALAKLGL